MPKKDARQSPNFDSLESRDITLAYVPHYPSDKTFWRDPKTDIELPDFRKACRVNNLFMMTTLGKCSKASRDLLGHPFPRNVEVIKCILYSAYSRSSIPCSIDPYQTQLLYIPIRKISSRL